MFFLSSFIQSEYQVLTCIGKKQSMKQNEWDGLETTLDAWLVPCQREGGWELEREREREEKGNKEEEIDRWLSAEWG